MGQTIDITSCEVCGEERLMPLMDLGEQPLCDDLVPLTESAEPPRFRLEVVGCPTCYTVHQKHQVAKELLFPITYHYRAAMTQDVLAGMQELVDVAETALGDLAGKVVLDIGSNDGSLLSRFKAKGAYTIGIEPTGAAQDAVGRIDVVMNRYFDRDAVQDYLSAHPRPDIITFTNVFAHIEDLDALLENLRMLMSERTTIIIENHYLGSVLARHQFDTFYHEHPRTYAYRSFQYIARKLGMGIRSVEFPPRYNGNIRVLFTPDASEMAEGPDESGFLPGFLEMNRYIEDFKPRLLQRLRDLAKIHGPLPAKGFPGRASILVNYFGLDETLIEAVYEKSGSPKVNHYVPGTRIPILDEAAFFQNPKPVLVNFAWHIPKEIHGYMRAKGYEGEIIEIFS